MYKKSIFRKIFILIAVISSNPAHAESKDSEAMALVESISLNAGMQSQFKLAMTQMLSQVKLIAQSKLEEMQNHIVKTYPDKQEWAVKGVTDAYQKIIERSERDLRSEISYEFINSKVIYPVFQKHFDAGELKEIDAFYKTSAGQKLGSLTGQISIETGQLFNQEVSPLFKSIFQRIMTEEMDAAMNDMKQYCCNDTE